MMTKKELRKKYKALRQECSTQELEEMSEAIVAQIKEHFDPVEKRVSVFLPIERFREINTWLLIDKVKNDYYLPVIKGDDTLIHVQYENRDQIKVSDWGIPEPIGGKEIDPGKLNYVLVPLLAIDKKGYRVGYGKGFYDRFLSQCSPDCIFIGLSYFEPIEAILDTNQYDIPLHFCVTPKGVIEF